VFLIEVPYLGTLLDQLEFDTIYHEHLSYCSLVPIERLCRVHGFCLVDVDRVDLHGGSVILHMRRQRPGVRPSQRLETMMREEDESGLVSPARLNRFGEAVRSWRGEFIARMDELQRGGARLIGYGAAAKGNTLLNYCPSVAQHLSCILDRSPHKQGRYTPGTHLPVRPVEHWTQSQATHMLILAWNFKDEIMRQMQGFAERGGRFVIPIPQPEVVEWAGAER
jgi:hypothetical protein